MLRDMYKTNIFLLGLRILAVLTAITGAVGLGWAVSVLSSSDAGALNEQIGYISLAVSGFWCLIVAAVVIFFNDPFHPAVFITIDVLLCMFTLAGGVCVVISPFADINWITCNERHSTSVCADSSEFKAVVWRFVSTAFCFLNSIIHLIAVVSASKVCHQRRKGPQGKRDDVELRG